MLLISKILPLSRFANEVLMVFTYNVGMLTGDDHNRLQTKTVLGL